MRNRNRRFIFPVTAKFRTISVSFAVNVLYGRLIMLELAFY